MNAAVLRTNSRYTFSRFNDLSTAELASLKDLASSGFFAGVLFGTGEGNLSLKAVSATICALLDNLRRPREALSVFPDLDQEERNTLIANLVLDEILEIDCGNGFYTGCGTFSTLFDDTVDIVGTDPIAKLSSEALEHCSLLPITQPELLAAKLYFYNRLPATLSWQRLWPNSTAVLNYLGCMAGSARFSRLESSFELSPGAAADWIFWRRTNGSSMRRECYKLYISPQPSYIRAAFDAVMHITEEAGLRAFKIGPNAQGLLRPDKFIMYFEDKGSLMDCAFHLSSYLQGVPAQPVPFTEALQPNGLLSWGADPPAAAGRVGWFVDNSWRIWICNRLAAALVSAVAARDPAVRPVRYALARLWLAGVDTRRWALRHEALTAGASLQR